MSGKLNLSNDDQIWIMDQFKKEKLRISDAETLASIISSGKDLMEKSGLVEKNEQETMTSPFTFGVVRFPFGFECRSGINNSMQIDFQKQNIYFMKGINSDITIPFSDVIGCYTNKNNHNMKLWTKHSIIEFFTDTDLKNEIEQLIWKIVRPNDIEITQPISPSERLEVTKVPSSPANGGCKMVYLNLYPELFREGIIEKKTDARIQWWSKRLLRVEGNRFSYYVPNKPGKPLGIVEIDTTTLIEPIYSEKDSFAVTVGGKSHYFRVKKYETPERTEGERNSWLIAFIEACNQSRYKSYINVTEKNS